MVPQGGRFVNYVQGDEVNRLIREFYAGVAAPQVTGASPS
jgi:hypothetical protein